MGAAKLTKSKAAERSSYFTATTIQLSVAGQCGLRRILNARQEGPGAGRRQSFDSASKAAEASCRNRKQESDSCSNFRHCASKLTYDQTCVLGLTLQLSRAPGRHDGKTHRAPRVH